MPLGHFEKLELEAYNLLKSDRVNSINGWAIIGPEDNAYLSTLNVLKGRGCIARSGGDETPVGYKNKHKETEVFSYQITEIGHKRLEELVKKSKEPLSKSDEPK